MYAHGRWITKRRLIGAVVAVAVIGLGVAAAVFLPDVLGSRSAEPTSSPTADVLSCPSTRLAGGDAQLGTVTWVDGGALLLLDLDTCEERTLVQVGVVPPVRLSHDGEWVAFGDGSIVPTAGGDILSPIGRSGYWQWSPTDDVLAGVTAAGGVVVGGPEDPRRMVLDDGSAAEQCGVQLRRRIARGGHRCGPGRGRRRGRRRHDDGLSRVAGDEGPAARRGVVPGRPLGVVLLEAPGTCRGAAQHRPGGGRRLGERVRSRSCRTSTS